MATFTFNADSAEVTGTSGVTKVGSTYQMTGTSGQIDIIADAGTGYAFDHATALESVTGGTTYSDNVSPTAVATTSYSTKPPELAFKTDAPTTGDWADGAWYSSIGNRADQRICVDFGESVACVGVRISNLHKDGGSTDRGMKNTTVSMSDEAGDFTGTYATDVGLTLGWSGEVAQHTADGNATEWQEFAFSSVISGRYGVIKVADNWGNGSYVGVRRIEFLIAPSISYDYTNDEAATNYVNVGNIAAMQGVANTGYQNEGFRLHLTASVAGSFWGSLTVDNYVQDMTPPSIPTISNLESVGASPNLGFFADWTEPTEGDFNRVEGELNIDSGGFVTINEQNAIASGTSMKFNESLAGTQQQAAGWMYQNHFGRNGYTEGQTAQIRMRSYDNIGNNSAYSTSSVLTLETVTGQATAPSLDGVTVADGSITLTLTANDEADVLYARVRRNSPAYGWEERSESFKRTGSGTITITGLINGIEYEVCGQAFASNLYSDFAGSRFAVPDSDAFAVSRSSSKFNIRNGRAQQNLNVAQRRGVKITFKNEGDEDAVLYATVAEPSTLTVGVKEGQIDRSDIIVRVPRQTNFPPSKFYPNCTFTLNDKSYQVDIIDFNDEDINMTSLFTLTASVIGDLDGY